MTKQIQWDDTRFRGSIYAILDGITVARIVRRRSYFDVFAAPDAPKKFHSETSGITMDSFRTLGAAKNWIVEFTCAS